MQIKISHQDIQFTIVIHLSFSYSGGTFYIVAVTRKSLGTKSPGPPQERLVPWTYALLRRREQREYRRHPRNFSTHTDTRMHSGVTQTRRSFSFLHLIHRRAVYYVGLLVRSRQSRQNVRRDRIAVHSPCFEQVDFELRSDSPRGKEETSCPIIRSFDDFLNNDARTFRLKCAERFARN